MFRIKPTRNQTTAKHVNLSPYPNNNLIMEKKTQIKAVPKLQPKLNQPKKIGSLISKNEVKPNINNIKPTQNVTKARLSSNLYVQSKQESKKANFTKQTVNNPQKANSQNNVQLIKKPLINNAKLGIPHNAKPHQRVVLKRSQVDHKQHKLKIEQNSKHVVKQALPQNKPLVRPTSHLKKDHEKRPTIDLKKDIVSVRKNAQNNIIKEEVYDFNKMKKEDSIMGKQQNVAKQIKLEQNMTLTEEKSFKIDENKQFQNAYLKQEDKRSKYKESKETSKQKQQPETNQQENKEIQIEPKELKHIPESKPKQQSQQEQRILKQSQMQEMMLKIQKRRQARQKQKLRQKQIEEKRKQNQDRALQFLNERNNRDRNHQGNIEGVSGMLKLNDQLMHFSLAETIMDLQVKKLLKTNFDDFPNASQIKYQVQELSRINMSYEMIRDDQTNPLRSGLQNYRVQIFNRIGQLIMKAQQQGYSNPNFHILQHDGRLPRQPNSIIPQAVRGLPQSNVQDFVKHVKNLKEQECTICLAQLPMRQEVAELQCGHRFHLQCIKQWVCESANCPTCRWNIKFGKK